MVTGKQIPTPPQSCACRSSEDVQVAVHEPERPSRRMTVTLWLSGIWEISDWLQRTVGRGKVSKSSLQMQMHDDAADLHMAQVKSGRDPLTKSVRLCQFLRCSLIAT
jgi:hypothetical protein